MDFSESYRNRAQHSILQVYDFGTGRAEVVARFPRVIEAPFWTKDGKALLYNCEGLIYRFDIESGAVSPVDTGDVTCCNNDHVLSPDGGAIAVSGSTDGTMYSRIYIKKLDDSPVRMVVPQQLSFLHGWSPDGKTLAYCAGREIGGKLEWDVYTCPVEGGAETRLTDADGLNDGPEYSSDGKTIWFNSVRTGLMQAWKMDADGGRQTQMTFDDDMNSWFPHISPDGARVVYIAYHKGDLEAGQHLPDKNVEIRMIPARGGKPETLAKLFGGQGSMNVNSWSPDSRRFAFVSYQA